jgi:hypothetical protein
MKDYNFFSFYLYKYKKKKRSNKNIVFILFDYQTGIHGARGRVVL